MFCTDNYNTNFNGFYNTSYHVENIAFGSFPCPAVATNPADLYPDPSDCASFYQCDDGRNAYHKHCADHLYFNANTLQCDYPENSGCGGGAYIISSYIILWLHDTCWFNVY